MIFIIPLVLIFLIAAIFIAAYSYEIITVFIQARASSVDIIPAQLLFLKLRGNSPAYIVGNLIKLKKAGIEAGIDEMESHVLAGGHLGDVVDAMISSSKAELNISFKKICSIDLAGRDVLSAVESCVIPLVITVPENGTHITGVSRDGVRLGVRIKITVKANIDKLIGGASEKTIEARVGEGIIVALGISDNHKEILENPERITEIILGKGLDHNTAFSIESVDVEEITVLDNVGAKLREDQADADQQVAQAKAEQRRALAIAYNEENKAKVIEMEALETGNKSVLPEQISWALRKGNLWRSPNPVYQAKNDPF
ncbi:MAG: flotillin-like FloA family protein [Lentisphaeria bacterium]|nr:flotillin-like FloA family protein [Lentisphaeria bacterium]NQZ69067.1 flotillin-like FloA family protein [Lentisphaeria bacterium]